VLDYSIARGENKDKPGKLDATRSEPRPGAGTHTAAQHIRPFQQARAARFTEGDDVLRHASKHRRTAGQGRLFCTNGRYTRGGGKTLLDSLYSGTRPPFEPTGKQYVTPQS
jgi:hypothetical protein